MFVLEINKFIDDIEQNKFQHKILKQAKPNKVIKISKLIKNIQNQFSIEFF